MVKIFKSEWHQVEKRDSFEVTEDFLEEVYPDNTKKKNKEILKGLKDGSFSVDTLMADVWDTDVEIDWDHEYDDWWTDRKGGYDVTYDNGEK